MQTKRPLQLPEIQKRERKDNISVIIDSLPAIYVLYFYL